MRLLFHGIIDWYWASNHTKILPVCKMVLCSPTWWWLLAPLNWQLKLSLLRCTISLSRRLCLVTISVSMWKTLLWMISIVGLLPQIPRMLGSLICEGVGSIFLGPKLVTIHKQKQKEIVKKEKQREEKRERKNTSHWPDFIKELIPLHLWSNRVEIWRRGSKLE